ncbi:TM2 domain-containing protein [Bergeyella sp. RCAD1439]|uniref:TM2 domain-containing protein n=1 Tax=Bergeyella anatis TaxID=3113737 RepID=UPI002E186B08|nr:TM2 domain-containing protein [Bergeyella sp. RCAD1439]
MNKHYLMSKMKSTGTAYLCWFFLGCHYAYLGRWGLQILYWITFGGMGIWALIDLFLMPSKVNAHNLAIARQIDLIEKKEQEEAYARNMALLNAANQNRPTE